jgi:hypothetical protein
MKTRLAVPSLGGEGRKAPWGHAPLRGQVEGEHHLPKQNIRTFLTAKYAQYTKREFVLFGYFVWFAVENPVRLEVGWQGH